jgi:lipopolysaccharide transport system permease protein
MAFIAAAFVPFLPDLRLVIENGLLVVFFLSGIFFDVNTFPGHIKEIMLYNPVLVIVDSYRQVFLHGTLPDISRLLFILVSALVVTILMTLLFRKLDHKYAKVVI